MTDRCDTCGAQPAAGGARSYVDVVGRRRTGCVDELACARRYSGLTKEQRRELEQYRRTGARP